MARRLPATPDTTERIIVLSLIVAAAILAVLSAIEPLLAVPLRVPQAYNEGWNAYWANRALGPGPLYPAAEPFISNNYPPLSFYLVGLAGRIMGDNIVAGRIVAVASIGVVSIWIGRCLIPFGVSRLWRAAVQMFFLLLAVTQFKTYFAINDPQWLAHAVMLAGLPFMLRNPPGRIRTGDLAAACMLFAAAGLIKHNLIALPLSVTVWLLWHDRGAFARWLLLSAGAAAACAALLYAAYGQAFFIDVFGHHRIIHAGNLRPSALLFVLGAALMLVWNRWDDPRTRLILLFTAIATLWGIIQRLGDGVTMNAYFDAAIAICLALGIALGSPDRRVPPLPNTRYWRPAVLTVALLAPVAWQLHTGKPLLPDMDALYRRERDWGRIINAAAAQPGPVACEMSSVCYWAGKPFELDFFNYGQKLYTGLPDASFRQAVLGHRYRMIVIDRQSLTGEVGRLPRDAIAMISLAYQPAGPAAEQYSILIPATGR